MLINDKKTKCPKLWRTLFMITIAVPQFVTLLLVRNLFSDSGIFNTMMANAGVTDFLKVIGLLGKNMDHIPFLTDQHWAKFMIILINIWIGVPYQMLIATGVLMNIPSDMLEASVIDGASPLQSFIHIKLPYLLSVQGPALVTDFVKNVNNFNVIYLLTQDVYITKDQALASSSAKEVDLLVTSFSTDRGINFRRFFPAGYTLDNYINILFHSDSVAQFPRWFMNTFVVACFNCVISTCFVLMVAYALSCCRFKGRKLLQNLSVIVNLFPGVLAMIAVYFVLKYLNLTNSYAGLIMVYAGSSGLGYLICKGFFDTIPVSLREAAKLGGLFLGLKKADKIPHGLVQIACFFGAHEPSPADQRRPIRAEKRCQAEVVRVLVVLRQEAEEVSKPLSGQLKRDIYIADIHPLGHFCAEMFLPPCAEKFQRPVIGLVGDAGRGQQFGLGHGLPCNEIARVAANAGLLHRAFVVAAQDGDVDLAVEDLAEQQIALLGHDGEPDVRMPQVIPHQQLGKFGLAEGVRRTDDDVLVCFALHGVQMGAERIHERKIRPGLFGQKFSLWGKFQPFGAAIDDGDAEFFLHVMEPLGQRGLCHEQFGRHAGQIRRLRKLVQNLPIRIFHCASLRSFLCSV